MEDLYNQIELCRNLKEINKAIDELKAISSEIEIKSRYVALTPNDILIIVNKQQEIIHLYQERLNLEVGSND